MNQYSVISVCWISLHAMACGSVSHDEAVNDGDTKPSGMGGTESTSLPPVGGSGGAAEDPADGDADAEDFLTGTTEVESIPQWEAGVPSELADDEHQECTFALGSYAAEWCVLHITCIDQYREGTYAAACSRSAGSDTNSCSCTWVDPSASAELMATSYSGIQIAPCVAMMEECTQVHAQ